MTAPPAFIKHPSGPYDLAAETYSLCIPGLSFNTLFLDALIRQKSGEAVPKWVLLDSKERIVLGLSEALSAEDAQRLALNMLILRRGFDLHRAQDERARDKLSRTIAAMQKLRALYPDPEPE